MSSDNESVSDRNEENEIESDTPLETETTEAVTEGENADPDGTKNDSDEESKKTVVKPKKIIRNPQPKLNEQTLKTARGLPAIKKHFKNLKTKGPGYEEHDLNVVMKTYEYWCHRLFPKYTFDDCIEKLEKLGSKKATQNYLKRIRLGMDELEEEQILDNEDGIFTTGFVEPFDDKFDQLMATNIAEPEPEITEEQLEMIRQNKIRAEALRNARLSKIGQSSQNISLDILTHSQSGEKEITEEEVEDTEVDVNNMLGLINDEPFSSTISTTNKHNGLEKDNIISNSIRSSLFSSLLNGNDESEVLTKSQRSNLQQNKTILESDESFEESDQYSDEGSIILNKSINNRQRKLKKIGNNKKRNSVRNHNPVESSENEDSDEESVKTKSQNSSVRRKKIIDSNKNTTDSRFTNRNNANESDQEIINSSDSNRNVTLKNTDNSAYDEGFSKSKAVLKNKKRVIDSDDDSNGYTTQNTNNEKVSDNKKRSLIENDDSNNESEINIVNKNVTLIPNSSIKQKRIRPFVETDDSNDAVALVTLTKKTENSIIDTSDEELSNSYAFKKTNVIASDEDD